MKYKGHKKTAIALAIAGGAAIALSGCYGGGGSDDSSTASLTPSQKCASLLKSAYPNVNISTATIVAAADNLVSTAPAGPVNGANSGPVPEHCLVQGVADQRTGADGMPYAIGFEVRMPTTTWNGRFFFQGGGAANGFLATAFGDLRGNILDSTGKPTDNALNRGFAVATTTGGHIALTNGMDNSSYLFGKDPQARLDYGYNAVARTTEIAKKLINDFFGKTADHSYFVGCSNGGRDGMVASQRIPEEFDGVFAMNPGFQFPKATLGWAWDAQQFSKVSANLHDAFNQNDLNLVSSKILAACDANDGAVDGMIQDPSSCTFKTAMLPNCATTGGTAGSGTCLSTAQIDALSAVYEGAKDASGNALYADYPWDAGLNYRNWRDWRLGRAAPDTGLAGPASQDITMGLQLLASVFMSPAKAIGTGYDYPTYTSFLGSFKTLSNPTGTIDPELIYGTSGIYTTPSMSKTQRGVGFMSGNSLNYDKFKNHGSKIIIAHGTADPIFSSNDTKNWYADLNIAYNGNAASFARYFPIPGMNHCAGGPATDKFDFVTSLVNWVEKGQAPDSVSATSRDQSYLYPTAYANYKPTLIKAGITRPLCASPKTAKYKGSGNVDDAANWSCQ